MNQELKYDFLIETKEASEDYVTISGYASTSDLDRHGDIVEASQWTQETLKNFKANPVLLFNHNYDNVIGGVTTLEVDSKGLKVTAQVDKTWDKWSMVENGRLKTFSIGFQVADYDYDPVHESWSVTVKDLLEVSIVTVPANPSAVFNVAKQLGTDKDLNSIKMKKLIEQIKNFLSKGELTTDDKAELKSLMDQAKGVLEPQAEQETETQEEASTETAPAVEDTPEDTIPEEVTELDFEAMLVELKASNADLAKQLKETKEALSLKGAGPTSSEETTDAPLVGDLVAKGNPRHESLAKEANKLYKRN
jgi:HK97 family phage prohead protease